MGLRFYFMILLLMATPLGAAEDPRDVAWSRLEFEATKFLLTARSEVELAARPTAEARRDLFDPMPRVAAVPTLAHLKSTEGAAEGLTPRGSSSGVLDIRTRILNRDSRVRFWFDPGDGRALQRSSHDLSKKRLRHRTYRYTQGGVFSHTRRPAEDETDRPHDSWSRIEERFVNLAPVGKTPVTEAAGLLYLIPAGDFHDIGDRERLRVFTRGKVREVDVKVAGKERIGVDYLEISDRGERTVDGKVEALRVAVRPLPGVGEDGSDFKLLGLQGDIDIYVDPASRVPLLVTGKVEVAGTVRLRLQRAVLR